MLPKRELVSFQQNLKQLKQNILESETSSVFLEKCEKILMSKIINQKF
jgi:hypothetical protein